ncbi:hypothetical protein [Streptomyces sp. 7N604]|uniref:hypothetical protein n=1 Tax=Streptomyces sp. 7N604 TaxID=3457415 RepID=UPI003FD230DA
MINQWLQRYRSARFVPAPATSVHHHLRITTYQHRQENLKRMARSWSHTAPVLVTVGALTLASGCAFTTNEKDTEKSPARAAASAIPFPGVVSRSEAKRFLQRYVKANNAANAKWDPALLSTVEGGALVEMSKAAYKQKPNMDAKERAEYETPWYYTSPTAKDFHIPPAGAASWFAITVTSWSKVDRKVSKEKALIIFDRDKDGRWKLVASSWIDPKKAELIAHDKHGFAIPVVQTSRKQGGAVAPDQLDEALADIYATGGTKAGDVFKESATTKWMRKIPKTHNSQLKPYAQAEFRHEDTEHQKVYALKTKDGGTLAVFNTALRETDFGMRPDAIINPSLDMQTFVGKKSRPAFLVYYLHQSTAYLPPNRKAELLTSEYEMTQVKGS